MNNGLITKINYSFYCNKSSINPKFEHCHCKSKQTKGYLVSTGLAKKCIQVFHKMLWKPKQTFWPTL